MGEFLDGVECACVRYGTAGFCASCASKTPYGIWLGSLGPLKISLQILHYPSFGQQYEPWYRSFSTRLSLFLFLRGQDTSKKHEWKTTWC